MTVSVARDTKMPCEILPVYEADDLTHGGAVARIKLEGQLYTLRITRARKLILTK